MVSSGLCKQPLDDVVSGAIAGGADIVQLREKELSDGDYMVLARRVLDICRTADVPMIVNDRVHICAAIGADGVHLGQDDLPLAEARAVAGPAAVIGLSTHNAEQLQSPAAKAADYLGVGPAFATETKPHEPEAGLDYLRTAAEVASVPCFAIGGIDADRLDAVLDTGVRRIAVSRVICAADDPKDAARRLRERLDTVPI